MTIEKIFIKTVTNVNAIVVMLTIRVVNIRLNHTKLPFLYVKAECWQLHISQPNKKNKGIRFSVCHRFLKKGHFIHLQNENKVDSTEVENKRLPV